LGINKVKITGSRDRETTGLKRKVLDRQIEKLKETETEIQT
jgi:hypothetical protein